MITQCQIMDEDDEVIVMAHWSMGLEGDHLFVDVGVIQNSLVLFGRGYPTCDHFWYYYLCKEPICVSCEMS